MPPDVILSSAKHTSQLIKTLVFTLTVIILLELPALKAQTNFLRSNAMAGANRRNVYNPGLPAISTTNYNSYGGYGSYGSSAPPTLSLSYSDQSLIGGVNPFENVITSGNQVPNMFGMVGRSSLDMALSNPGFYPSASSPYSSPSAPYPTQPINLSGPLGAYPSTPLQSYGGGGGRYAGSYGTAVAGAYGIDVGIRDLNTAGTVNGQFTPYNGFNQHGIDVVHAALNGGLLGGQSGYPAPGYTVFSMQNQPQSNPGDISNESDNKNDLLTSIHPVPPDFPSDSLARYDPFIHHLLNSDSTFTLLSFPHHSPSSPLHHTFETAASDKGTQMKLKFTTFQSSASNHERAIITGLGTDVSVRSSDLNTNPTVPSGSGSILQPQPTTTTPTATNNTPSSTSVFPPSRPSASTPSTTPATNSANAPTNAEVLRSIDMALAERFHNSNGDPNVFGKGFGSVLFEGLYVGGTSIYNQAPGGVLYQRQPVAVSVTPVVVGGSGALGGYNSGAGGYGGYSGGYSIPSPPAITSLVTSTYARPYVDQNANGVYTNLDINQGLLRTLPAAGYDQPSYSPPCVSGCGGYARGGYAPGGYSAYSGAAPVTQRQQWGNGLGFQQFSLNKPPFSSDFTTFALSSVQSKEVRSEPFLPAPRQSEASIQTQLSHSLIDSSSPRAQSAHIHSPPLKARPFTTFANGLGVNIIGTRKPTAIGVQYGPSGGYSGGGYPSPSGYAVPTGYDSSIGLNTGYGYDGSISSAPAYLNTYSPPAVGSGPIGYAPTMQGGYFSDYGIRQGYFYDDTFHASFAAPAAPIVSGGHYFFSGTPSYSVSYGGSTGYTGGGYSGGIGDVYQNTVIGGGSGGGGYGAPTALYSHQGIANPDYLTDGSGNMIRIEEFTGQTVPTVTIRTTGDVVGSPSDVVRGMTGSNANSGVSSGANGQTIQQLNAQSVGTASQMLENAQNIVNGQRTGLILNGNGSFNGLGAVSNSNDITSIIINPQSSSTTFPSSPSSTSNSRPNTGQGSVQSISNGSAEGASLGPVLGSSQSQSQSQPQQQKQQQQKEVAGKAGQLLKDAKQATSNPFADDGGRSGKLAGLIGR